MVELVHRFVHSLSGQLVFLPLVVSKFVDQIQAALGAFDGIVINPAAYTHTSVAILDALKAVAIPAVEVHISNIDARESFRQISYPGMACEKTIKGQGLDGYRQAIVYLHEKYRL